MFEQNSVLYKVSASTGAVQTWTGRTEGAKVIVSYGQEEGKIQDSEYTAEPKNTGRSNATTAEEQALLELQALYQKQIDNKHYHTTREAALTTEKVIPRKIKNYKDGHKGMSEVLYTSLKKNGSRACVIRSELYSKIGRVEEVKVPHLKEALDMLGDIATFDAEVYAHGLSLQRIRSAWLKPFKTVKEIAKMQKEYLVKTGKVLPYDPNEDAAKLKFHVFDIPVVGVPFKDRVDLMKVFQVNTELFTENSFEFIYPEITVNHESRMEKLLKVAEEGYEGLVHYEPEGVYEYGKRSTNTQKSKPRYDAEALVTGVERCKNGEGKLCLTTCDELGNVDLTAMMKGTRAERDYDNQLQYIGQWVTFQYEELSDKGVPTKGVVKEVRKCNDAGEPLE